MSNGTAMDQAITADDPTNPSDGESFQWTYATIAQSIALFLLAGVAEILGGWMVW